MIYIQQLVRFKRITFVLTSKIIHYYSRKHIVGLWTNVESNGRKRPWPWLYVKEIKLWDGILLFA